MSRSPWSVIEKALSESFPSEGERFAPELLPPMTEAQFEAFEAHFAKPVPEEIKDLLAHTTGFSFHTIGSVRFDRVPGSAGMEFIPDGILLCTDSEGLKWVLNTDSQNGAWGKVYVIDGKNKLCVLQAENLATFLSQLFHTVENRINWLDHIRNKVLPDLKKQSPLGINMIEAVRHTDHTLRKIAHGLPQDAMLFDMREAEIGEGFSWGNGIIGPSSHTNVFTVIPEKRPFWKRWFS